MAINHIIIGPRRDPLFEFENEDILSCVVNNTVDPIGNQLPINTAEIEIQSSGTVVNFCPADYPDGMQSSDGIVIYCRNQDYGIDTLPHATEIHIDVDGNNVGFYYLDKVQQVGPSRWHIDAFNYVGLLEEVDSQRCISLYGTSVGSCVQTILSRVGSGVSGRLAHDEMYNNLTPASGFVTVKSAREALQELLFACGVVLVETSSDSIEIREIAKQSVGEIPPAMTFDNGSAEYSSPVHSITVSEYLFTRDLEAAPEIIFDNTDASAGPLNNYYLYIPGIPLCRYYTDGTLTAVMTGSLSEPGMKSFKLNGKGRLYGNRFITTKQEVTLVNPDVETGEDISIDSYAITPLNSDAILRRMAAYYFAKRITCQTDIVWNGEAPGSRYDVTTPFKTTESGTLTNTQITLSGTPRAACTFEARWEPVSTAAYQNSVMLTGSGVWEVPDGVDSIRVALIGGGSGGSSGTKGKNGTADVLRSPGTSGTDGGESGTCGASGKIYVATIQDPDASYSYACGAGGAGGAESSSTSKHNDGLPGGETTFGLLSSSSGSSDNNGYTDLITKAVYGASIEKSMWGMVYTNAGITYTKETSNGYVYQFWDPAYTFKKYDNLNATYPYTNGYAQYDDTKFSVENGGWFYAFHGASGGCSALKAGARGKKSVKSSDGKVHLGNGGNGATPTEKGAYPLDISKNNYGSGGGPGHGGGGGGNAGFAVNITSISWAKDYLVAGKAGVGGNGGPGGDGAPGCIIIYY